MNIFDEHIKKMSNYMHSFTIQNRLKQLLEQRGVCLDNVIVIFLTGSSVFFDNYHDLDFHIIVKKPFAGMHHRNINYVDGHPTDLIFYTEQDIQQAWNSRYSSFFWCPLSYYNIFVYGDINFDLEKYNILNYPEYWEEINNAFYSNFILPSEIRNDECHKRYWNFLAFYNIITNQTYNINNRYYKLIQEAHDENITKDYCYKQYVRLYNYISCHCEEGGIQ